MTAPLAIAGLTVEYSSGGYSLRPLKDFHLEMASGELGILLGASGCGKTTLLSAVAGLLKPVAGSIRVGGTEVVGLGRRDLAHFRQRGVGIVFQSFNLLPSLTARENIQLVLLTAGVSRSAARRRADELLELVGLSDRANHRPGALSGGQQQRVAIARALALDPPLLLADEPTAHLDYIQVDSVLAILRQLADAQRTVLVSTHDDRLVPLADRVFELTPRRAPPGAEETRALRDGEVLFSQGDPGALVYIVESGTVRLLRERVDGPDEVVADVTVGEYFGELAPMFAMPRSASARALGDAVVRGLPLAHFREHMANARKEQVP